MATVTFIKYQKQSAGALRGVAGYVSQKQKTEQEDGWQLVSGQNCTPQLAAQEFIAMLGKLYLTGLGVTHDQTQAMDWFSRSAAQGNQYAQFFLEHQNDLRPPSVMLAATRLLYHMSRIFEDHSLPQSSAGLHVDRKLRRRIQEKKIALGHKPDDHEEELIQTWGGMTMK